MTSHERMALWATFNMLLRANGRMPLLYSDVRQWWERYESALEFFTIEHVNRVPGHD